MMINLNMAMTRLSAKAAVPESTAFTPGETLVPANKRAIVRAPALPFEPVALRLAQPRLSHTTRFNHRYSHLRHVL